MALIPSAATTIAPLVGVVDALPTVAPQLRTMTGGAPLEDGRQVTDHAVAAPARLTVTGWVSTFETADKPGKAWEAIRKLHADVEVLEVITPLGTWKECIIKRAEAHQHGRGIRFQMELEEVLRVQIGSSLFGVTQPAASGPGGNRRGTNERGRVHVPPIASYQSRTPALERGSTEFHEFWQRVEAIKQFPERATTFLQGQQPTVPLPSRPPDDSFVGSDALDTVIANTDAFLNNPFSRVGLPGMALTVANRGAKYVRALIGRQAADAAIRIRNEEFIAAPVWQQGDALNRVRPRAVPQYVRNAGNPNIDPGLNQVYGG